MEVLGAGLQGTVSWCLRRLLGEAAAERQWLDPHALLGLQQTDSEKPAAVKKAFRRLSLLIHPDKCQHPRANDAFQAVTKAAEALQVSHTPPRQKQLSLVTDLMLIVLLSWGWLFNECT